MAKRKAKRPTPKGQYVALDWTKACDACNQKPVMPATGLCPYCTTGDTAFAAEMIQEGGYHVG